MLSFLAVLDTDPSALAMLQNHPQRLLTGCYKQKYLLAPDLQFRSSGDKNLVQVHVLRFLQVSLCIARNENH